MKKIFLLFLGLLFLPLFAMAEDLGPDLSPRLLPLSEVTTAKAAIESAQPLTLYGGAGRNEPIRLILVSDPRCGDCHEAHPWLERIHEQYPAVEIQVLPVDFISNRERAFSSNPSADINGLVYAAYRQNSIFGRNLYDQVMTYDGKQGKLTKEVVLNLAHRVKGLNVQQLERDAASDDKVQQALVKNHAYVFNSRLAWTPSFYLMRDDHIWQVSKPEDLGRTIDLLLKSEKAGSK